MSLTQYYTASTLDGFIADPDNSLEWLFTRQRDEHGPLSYEKFIADVGALAMGSTTYEWILDHEFAEKDPAAWKWPYDIPSWVFTHRRLPVVPNSGVKFTSADIATVHREMVEAAGARNIWIVGGGDLAGQFRQAQRLGVCVEEARLVPGRAEQRPGIPVFERQMRLAAAEIDAALERPGRVDERDSHCAACSAASSRRPA